MKWLLFTFVVGGLVYGINWFINRNGLVDLLVMLFVGLAAYGLFGFARALFVEGGA